MIPYVHLFQKRFNLYSLQPLKYWISQTIEVKGSGARGYRHQDSARMFSNYPSPHLLQVKDPQACIPRMSPRANSTGRIFHSVDLVDRCAYGKEQGKQFCILKESIPWMHLTDSTIVPEKANPWSIEVSVGRGAR